MLSKLYTFAVLILLSCGTVYCQKLYKPTDADSQRTGIPKDSLNLGRKLYVNNCSSCHSLYMPDQFSHKEWNRILTFMQPKARISDQQKTAILKYLHTGTAKN